MTGHFNKNDFYSLPDGINRGELLRRLTSENSFALEAPKKKTEEFLDTFDRRLHNSGLVLIKEGISYYLKNLSDGSVVESFNDKQNLDPKFWWDLPKCGLKKELRKSIDIRALLSLAKIQRSIAVLRLLNKDKKTVLFVYIKDLKVLDNPHDKYSVIVQTKALRGYENEANEFGEYLVAVGLEKRRGDILAALESNLSKYPLDYSSKINVHLKPDMIAPHATRQLLKNLFKTMRANEFGIIKDIDTEFLHDFRVAVRRTRSALSQIKEVFPEDVTIEFKTKFSDIAKATNELRDLDVYLLKEDSYKNMLPDDLRNGLDPLFKSLAEKRAKALEKCAAFLRSERYKEIVRSWEIFLNTEEPADTRAKNSETYIIHVAKEHIWKKYSKTIKLGSKITSSTPDPMLHSLRIECKKLRYLLEFFMSLFPEEEMKNIIKRLKKLQDNLGDFNDLHVQQESLKFFLSEHNIGYDPIKANTQAAAGGLISVLYQKQIRYRKKFSDNFNEFSDKDTTELFNKLFKGG